MPAPTLPTSFKTKADIDYALAQQFQYLAQRTGPAAPALPAGANLNEWGLSLALLRQVNHYADNIEGMSTFVDVALTSAQVLALNATPITLVAAPGAGKALIFEGAVVHKPAGTAYADIAAGEDLAIKYTDGSGADVAVVETTGFLDQAGAVTRYARPQTGALAAGTVSDITPVANAALVAHMLVGEIITGTSPIRFRVFYRVVPTVLT